MSLTSEPEPPWKTNLTGFLSAGALSPSFSAIYSVENYVMREIEPAQEIFSRSEKSTQMEKEAELHHEKYHLPITAVISICTRRLAQYYTKCTRQQMANPATIPQALPSYRRIPSLACVSCTELASAGNYLEPC